MKLWPVDHFHNIFVLTFWRDYYCIVDLYDVALAYANSCLKRPGHTIIVYVK